MIKRLLANYWHYLLVAVIAVGGFLILRSVKQQQNREAYEDTLAQVNLWCRGNAECLSGYGEVFDACYDDNHSWRKVGRREREHVLNAEGLRACLAEEGIAFPTRGQ